MEYISNNQQAGPVTMVVLPESALMKFDSQLSELKALILGKAAEAVKSSWIESEAARKEVGVSKTTWQTYRANRAIPFSQFGRKIFVKRSDLEAFLEGHKVK